MSIDIMRHVWEHSRAHGSAKLLLLALAWHADESGVAWPGKRQLARYAGLSPRSVTRVIHDLTEMGELVVYPRTGTSSIYLVTVGLTDDQWGRAQIAIAQLCHSPDLAIAREGVSQMTRVSPATGGGVNGDREVVSTLTGISPAEGVSPVTRGGVTDDTGVTGDRGVTDDTGGVSRMTRGGVTGDTQKDHYRSENRQIVSPGAVAPGARDDPTARGAAMRLRAFLETSPGLDQPMDEESQAGADTLSLSASDGSLSVDESDVFSIDAPHDAVKQQPTRRRSERQRQLDAMVEALREAFGWSTDEMTASSWGLLRRAGRELLDAGATPADVPGLYRYVVGRYPDATAMALAKYWPGYRAGMRHQPTDEGELDPWVQQYVAMNMRLFGHNGQGWGGKHG